MFTLRSGFRGVYIRLTHRDADATAAIIIATSYRKINHVCNVHCIRGKIKKLVVSVTLSELLFLRRYIENVSKKMKSQTFSKQIA